MTETVLNDKSGPNPRAGTGVTQTDHRRERASQI